MIEALVFCENHLHDDKLGSAVTVATAKKDWFAMRCVSLVVNADCLILLHCSVAYFIWFAKCSWCHRWEGSKPYYDIENMSPGSDFRQVCRARCSDGSRNLWIVRHKPVVSNVCS